MSLLLRPLRARHQVRNLQPVVLRLGELLQGRASANDRAGSNVFPGVHVLILLLKLFNALVAGLSLRLLAI